MARSLSLLIIVGLVACGSRPPPPTTDTPDAQSQAAPASDAGPDPQANPLEATPQPTEPAPAQAAADHHAAELAAYERAKPVFDKFCANCHAQGRPGARPGTLSHLDITRYPFAGHHADTVAATVRKSLGIDGGKATMPKNKPGSVTGADLALIKAWTDAFDAAHAGAAHASTDAHHGEHNDGHAH